MLRFSVTLLKKVPKLRAAKASPIKPVENANALLSKMNNAAVPAASTFSSPAAASVPSPPAAAVPPPPPSVSAANIAPRTKKVKKIKKIKSSISKAPDATPVAMPTNTARVTPTPTPTNTTTITKPSINPPASFTNKTTKDTSFARDNQMAESTDTNINHTTKINPTPKNPIPNKINNDNNNNNNNNKDTGATSSATQKTALVKGYKMEEVSSLCNADDSLFARRLPNGGCQFFAWPGTCIELASSAILSMPETIRTVHSVFGRDGVAVDVVMDVDSLVPSEYQSLSKVTAFQKKVIHRVLKVLHEEIEKIGEKVESQVILQSPNLKKASFHVHTRLKDAAFEDYRSLHGFLATFHDRMPDVDLQIYRPNGMLRMFSSLKENRTSAMIVYEDPECHIGFPNGKVPDAAAALHSVIIRPRGTFSRTLTFRPPKPSALSSHGGKSAAAKGADDGTKTNVASEMVLLPLTEREAVENAIRWLKGATPEEVSEWKSWVGLGISAYRVAHHFRNSTVLKRPVMEEMLHAWVEASSHCQSKFRHGECETRWNGFSIQKLGGSDNWWLSYVHLGRLANAQKEIRAQRIKAEKEAANKREQKKQS